MYVLVKEAKFASKCELETCDGLGYMMLSGGGDGELKGVRAAYQNNTSMIWMGRESILIMDGG